MSEYLIAVIQGIIEGLTEFLPVSSTGHLILTGELLNFTSEKSETFKVVIQLGAILAVAVLYWKRILNLLGLTKESNPRPRGQRLSLIHIIVACLPAMVLGLALHGVIKEYLFSSTTVLIGLVVGGLFMIYAEKRKNTVTATDIDDITVRQAFQIGLFQCLAMWPGFSRAGSTIAGGLIVGTNHKAAADFSFLVALPMMVAASGYDLYKSWDLLQASDFGFFAVGFLVAFVVALIASMTFVKLLSRVKLTPFAYYRFILAAVFYVAVVM